MDRGNIRKEIVYKKAATAQEYEEGRGLFLEYADSLHYDLCFQGFEEEVKAIDSQYSEPAGALLLAYQDDRAIACAGIRRFDEGVAELKRMFVLPHFRGQHIGRGMLEIALHTAKELGYKKILLDTMPSMLQAKKLYLEFGFTEMPAYRYNPVKGAVFMEKKLD
jgi:putative acetyltransferase